jgi:hypothetical protein
VLGNPLRYRDPTGHFEEDEIKQYLGVDPEDSWENVLALFGEGGRLEGRWGWLYILRRARLGHIVRIADDSGNRLFEGEFREVNGLLSLVSENLGNTRVMAHESAALTGHSYGLLSRTPHGPFGPTLNPITSIYATDRRNVLSLDASAVDWIGAGLDVGGLVIDGLTCGGGQMVEDSISFLRTAEDTINLASVGWSGPPWLLSIAIEDMSVSESVGFGVDLLDLVLPVPFAADIAGLIVNFGAAIELGP